MHSFVVSPVTMALQHWIFSPEACGQCILNLMIALIGFQVERDLDTALDLFVGQFQLKRAFCIDVQAGQAGQDVYVRA